jgi:hypothetical protein
LKNGNYSEGVILHFLWSKANVSQFLIVALQIRRKEKLLPWGSRWPGSDVGAGEQKLSFSPQMNGLHAILRIDLGLAKERLQLENRSV